MEKNYFVIVFQKLLEFFKLRNVSQENENEALVEFALSKEEDAEHKNNPDSLKAEDVLEICKSIDHTNETIQKWYDEGKTDVTKFGVKEISELAREIDPEQSEEKIKEEINKTIDTAVVGNARVFADELAGEGNELTDEEIKKITDQVNREEE